MKPEKRRVITPSSRTRRNRGYSLSESLLCLLFLAGTWVATDFIDGSRDAATANADRRDQGIAIAQAQSDVALKLPYDRFAPTEGFVPAGWIALPGLGAGEIPVDFYEGGNTSTALVYYVSYSSEDADYTGKLRRITILVEWPRANGKVGKYMLESVRAG